MQMCFPEVCIRSCLQHYSLDVSGTLGRGLVLLLEDSCLLIRFPASFQFILLLTSEFSFQDTDLILSLFCSKILHGSQFLQDKVQTLKKDFTYLFLEKGEGREKEGEKNGCARETLIGRNTDWLPLMCAPAGDLAHNPDKSPHQESSWQPFSLWTDTQSTEPHQSGPSTDFLMQGKQVHIFKCLYASAQIIRA